MRNPPKWAALTVLAFGAATALAQPAASQPATPPAAQPAAKATTQPATQPAAGQSADPEDLKTTIAALKARLRDQDNRLAELEAQQSKQAAGMAQIAKDMAADAGKRGGGMPSWLDNLKFLGDMRLRGQNDYFSGEDNNGKPRNRERFRLRFGVIKTWLEDQMETGFRLASGNNNDPTSTNQTLDDQFTKKPIWIDQAWVKYSPKVVPGLTVEAGKFATPMVNTDMIWDPDVNPEGFWAQYKPKLGAFEPFVNVGYFMLQENYPVPSLPEASARDVDITMQSYQVGLDWKISKEAKYTFAATYYNWDDFEYAYRAANGNQTLTGHHDGTTYTRLARGFQTVDIINKVDLTFDKLPVISPYFDWVHNYGQAFDDRAYDGQVDGYAAGLKVGQNKKKGDWSAGYKYAYIEANATPGTVNDSDFGYSNRKGSVIGGTYNLEDFLTLGANVYLTEPIIGADEGKKTVTTQIDLLWKF
jgi:hypothetical protein